MQRAKGEPAGRRTTCNSKIQISSDERYGGQPRQRPKPSQRGDGPHAVMHSHLSLQLTSYCSHQRLAQPSPVSQAGFLGTALSINPRGRSEGSRVGQGRGWTVTQT